MKKIALACSMFALLAFVAATAANAQDNPYSKLNFKVAYTNSTEPIRTWNVFLCDELEKRSGGRYTIDRYLDGQLGLGDEDATIAVSENSIQILLGGEPTVNSVASDIVGCAGIPFAFKNKEHCEAFWRTYLPEINQRTREVYNVVIINKDIMQLRGARCLTANKPIRELADMSGVKLRTSSNIVIVNAWKAITPDVSTIALAELYGALQTGVVNAQENPIEFIHSYSFNEVQKYLMLTRHYYGVRFFITNETFWNSLNDADRELFTAVVEEASKGYNREADASEDKLLEDLRAKGMNIIPAEEIKLDEFRDKAISGLKTTRSWNQAVWDKIIELGESL